MTTRIHDDELRQHVLRIVTGLQERALGAAPRARGSAIAELAVLRRGVGSSPGDDVSLVGLTVGGLYPTDARLDDEPTDAEHAAHAAITLYALHQQSRSTRMHQVGPSFGTATRMLGQRTNATEAVRRRFTALATAVSWAELAHHARGLVQQFRAHEVPLDYGRLAVDLRNLRNPARAHGVRLAWGRHYFAEPAAETA